MSNHPADKIRQTLRSYVARHVTLGEDAMMLETTLIRDGMYCGRRFALEGFQVVYFVEEGQIKLYGVEGEILQTCRLHEFLADSTEQKRAA